MQRRLGSPDQDTLPLPRVSHDPAGETPEQAEGDSQLAPSPSPVFVDSSGRRQRRVRRLGRLLVVPAAVYVALLVSTLLGGPTVDSPLLPLPASPAARSHAPGTPPGGGAQPTGSGSQTGGRAQAAGSATGSGSGTATGSGAGATPSAGATSSPSATAAATSAAPTRGNSTHSATAPGSSHRATPSKKA
jgi:hypothetical protein